MLNLISAHNITNHTPLHLACFNGKIDYAVELYDLNQSLSFTNYGWSALHCASYSGNKDLVEFLLNKGFTDQNTVDKITAYNIAKTYNHKTCMDLLDKFKL